MRRPCWSLSTLCGSSACRAATCTHWPPELGSDVPFALHGGTALGTGRGEELATVLARSTFHWVLAFADGGLSTPAVFAEIDRLRESAEKSLPSPLDDPEPVLAALASGDPAELAPLLGNDLQPAALSLDPGLRRTLRAGVEAGALAGIVSGSGPTCAFLCASAHVGGRRRRPSWPAPGCAARCGWPAVRCRARGVVSRALARPQSVTRTSITAIVWQLLKSCLR